ncbi:MAG: hypothetical protein EOM12_09675 [Verrucomicrobiae bacterium]|nr:hypothetical protein [Verrucomicrobiae bacterium]
MKFFSTNRHNKTASYIAPVATAIAFLFAANLQAQQYPAKEGYAFEDAQYLYKWVTPEYPPLPDVKIDGEFFTWEEVYGPLPQKDPILVRNAKYPKIKTVVELPTKSVAPKAAAINQSYKQTIKKLHDRVDYFIKNEKESRERLFSLAEEKGIQTTIKGETYDLTLVDISETGEPIYVAPCNIRSVATVEANKLWPTNLITALPIATGHSGLNLDGTGQVLGIWEAADNGASRVKPDHPQFLVNGNSRISIADPLNTTNSAHATAVAGVIASAGIDDLYVFNSNVVNLGNYSRGICYNGTIRSHGIFSGFTSTFSSEAASGLKLANNSYGTTSGWVQARTSQGVRVWVWLGGTNSGTLKDWKFGSYMENANGISPRELDLSAVNAPHSLMVFAAGNSANVGPGTSTTYYYPNGISSTTPRNWKNGDVGNYDTLLPNACAKNVLTVGGIYDTVSSEPSPTIAPFSSFGPTDDGRIKPEIVATATCSESSSYSPFGLSGIVLLNVDDEIKCAFNSGTSFAAPIVTGGLGLVLQRLYQIRPEWSTNNYPIRSSTLRALAVHTATPATTNPGPSFKFGYGIFNASEAVKLMDADAQTDTKPYIKEVLLTSGNELQFDVIATNSASPIKITIAWTDIPGVAQSTGVVDESTKRLVNDLDLRIYSPGETNYNLTNAFKPFILNSDLVNRSDVVRGAAATTGDDSLNNLEQVVVNTPNPNGVYTVRVTHKGETLSGCSQWVSVIVSGVEVSEDDFEVTNLLSLGNNQYSVEWKSVVGGIYVLQSATLATGPWIDETSELCAYQELMSAQTTSTSDQKFFRIKRLY